jgi:protein-disulfide isomerase
MRAKWALLMGAVLLAACRGYVTVLGDRVTSLPGYDLERWTVEAREAFLKILNSELCPCGDAHHVARCIASSLKCPDSHRMARFAARRLAAGDSLSRVVLMLDRMFQQGEKPVLIPIGGAPLRGDPGAAVTVVEFSDFECPYCGKAQAALRKALAAFPGKVRLAFLHFPLERIHPNAMLASMAAVAAGYQGKFWEMHDLLFENQRSLSREAILGYAKRIGLDGERFARDLAHPRTRARVEADVALGKKLGIRGTPSTFVDGRRLQGAHRFENYRDYIEAALDAAAGSARAAR